MARWDVQISVLDFLRTTHWVPQRIKPSNQQIQHLLFQFNLMPAALRAYPTSWIAQPQRLSPPEFIITLSIINNTTTTATMKFSAAFLLLTTANGFTLPSTLRHPSKLSVSQSSSSKTSSQDLAKDFEDTSPDDVTPPTSGGAKVGQAEVVLVGCGAPNRGMGWYHAVQMLEGR